MHSKLPVAVITVLKKENKILLLKRKNTPWLN
jgi:ADP-ribose pyrophosphatase YjhB (NUDIX family)